MRCNFVRSLTGALVLVAALAACAPDASNDGRDLGRVTQAAAFPGGVEFFALHCADGTYGDASNDSKIGNGERELVGDAEHPTFLRAADQENLYFRLRVDLDPLAPDGVNLKPSSWDVLFGADATAAQYMLTADGNLQQGSTRVQWIAKTFRKPADMDSPASIVDLDPTTHVWVDEADSWFGGNADYFVTLAVPKDFLTTAGFELDTVVFWAGTNSQNYSLNGDITCSATPASDLPSLPPPSDGSLDPNVPDAVNDAVTTDEDTPVTIDVLANDWGGQQPGVTVTITSPPEHGTAVVNGDGTVTYTPAPNWNGTDSFTYTVTNPTSGKSSTGTVTVTVTPVDDGPPVAVDDGAQTPIDTPVTTAVLANDTVVDAPATVTVAEGPQHGTAAANANGTITYTPEAGWSGTDSYTYSVADLDGQSDVATVTVIVTAPAAPPSPAADGDGTGTGALPDATTSSQPAAVALGVSGGGCSSGPGGAASALLIGLLALARRRR